MVDLPEGTTLASAKARASDKDTGTHIPATSSKQSNPNLPGGTSFESAKARASNKFMKTSSIPSRTSPERNKKEAKFSDLPEGTSFASDKARVSQKDTSSSKFSSRRDPKTNSKTPKITKINQSPLARVYEVKTQPGRTRRIKFEESVSPVQRMHSRRSRYSRSPQRKIHENLYQVSQAQQEEGRRRRKEIEERLASEKELRTRSSFSKSPAKHVEGRSSRLTSHLRRNSKSRSPARLVHENLYNDSQPKQEEGRRRRKRIEEKILSQRELRTGSSRSRSPEKGTVNVKKQSRQPSNTRSPNRVHESLYNRSKSKQEEGRLRRKKVEEKLSSYKKPGGDSSRNNHRKGRMTEGREPSRNGRYSGGRNQEERDNAPYSPKAQMRHKRNETEGIFNEEMSKAKKKISIYQAENLYERLMSHKNKTEERKRDLRRQSEDREVQWMNEKSQRKIPLDKATRIYYRGTVTSRSRSRGREEYRLDYMMN